jgi:hypothetical protein
MGARATKWIYSIPVSIVVNHCTYCMYRHSLYSNSVIHSVLLLITVAQCIFLCTILNVLFQFWLPKFIMMDELLSSILLYW